MIDFTLEQCILLIMQLFNLLCTVWLIDLIKKCIRYSVESEEKNK